MSDCEGKISSKTSKQLLPLIQKLDDTYQIGYLGREPYNKEYVLNFFLNIQLDITQMCGGVKEVII